MERRAVMGLGLAAAAAAVTPADLSAQYQHVVTDRNGAEIKVGMFVNIPCLIAAITPSLNPALTSVTIQTFPNVNGVDYDEGLTLIVYPAQVLKA